MDNSRVDPGGTGMQGGNEGSGSQCWGFGRASCRDCDFVVASVVWQSHGRGERGSLHSIEIRGLIVERGSRVLLVNTLEW